MTTRSGTPYHPTQGLSSVAMDQTFETWIETLNDQLARWNRTMTEQFAQMNQSFGTPINPRRPYQDPYFEPNPRRSDPKLVHQTLRTIGLEAPTFDGCRDPKVYLDWEKEMDQYFEWNDMSEQRKYQIAKFRLVRQAKLYWEHDEWLDRLPIATWMDMKLRLRERYLPLFYHQRILDQQSPTSEITYFDCHKEEHYISQCSIPSLSIGEIAEPEPEPEPEPKPAPQPAPQPESIESYDDVEVYEAGIDLIDEYEEQESLIGPEPAEECVERMTYEEEPESKPESPEECGDVEIYETGEELVVEEETAEETPIEPELTKESDEEMVYDVGENLIDEYIGELEENDSEPIEPLGNFINQVEDNLGDEEEVKLIDVEKSESSDLLEEFKADLNPVTAEESDERIYERNTVWMLTARKTQDPSPVEHPQEVRVTLDEFKEVFPDSCPKPDSPFWSTPIPNLPHWDKPHAIDLVPVIFNYYFWKILWYLLGTQRRFTATYLKLCAKVFRAI